MTQLESDRVQHGKTGRDSEGVLCDRRMPVKLKGIKCLHICGQISSVVWCRDLGNNERTIKKHE